MSKLISINPKNYQVLGEVEISTESEISEKVSSAKQALSNWKKIGLSGRISLLNKLPVEFERRKEQLARLATNEMGMPITQSRADIDDAVRFFYSYLKHAEKDLSPETSFEDDLMVHRVIYEPIGVTAVITPWNFPLSNFVWGAGQNLIVGNTVVYKTSEECPLFGKLLEEIIQSCSLPEGVFSEIYGDGLTGEFLINQEIDLICFTGSTIAGKKIFKIAAEKFIKSVMELGGSAPGIIFEDADIDSVLETIYSNRFTNCGQMCDALKRLIVHESKCEEVIKKLKGYLSNLKTGDPDKEDTDLGPLVAKRQLELLEEQVKDALDKGAEIVTGGKRPDFLDGAFFEPTVLTGITPDMKVWQQEVFGPVLPVVTFKTDEEAVQLANDTQYGLGSYIYTKDSKKAIMIADQIQAGMVSVNNAGYINPKSPFGGYKASGIGREHGKFGFQELSRIKIIASEKSTNVN